jgi:hypothetical protein
MHILHLTAHLGGGVGKAHAALRAAMPKDIRETYLLLEEPRDRRYADEIQAHGGDIVVAKDLNDIARRCAGADIVQFEFWNHPKLFECLAREDFPAMRSVFWSHISGLFKPVIATGFLTAADRFVFTTPASLVLGEGLLPAQRSGLSSIGSGFGFQEVALSPVAPPSALPGISPSRGESDSRLASRVPSTLVAEHSTLSGCDTVPHPLSTLEGEMPGRAEGGNQALNADHPITYLGTVDFIKMHPGFFDAIDALPQDVSVSIWGGYDPYGEVTTKIRSVRHPPRIHLMGQTNDPQSALSQSQIFFYPLQPDHYGTAENALIEAMSLGLVPVVLANPAECAIVDHGVTGFIGQSIEACTVILDRLLSSPEEVARVGRNAAKTAQEKFTPGRSVEQFITLWSDLLDTEKRTPDFAKITGDTPLDWYCATQFSSGEKRRVIVDEMTGKLSKGTLAHFRDAFPDHPCWRVAEGA